MSDSKLQADIMEELEFQPGIEASHIGVAVENGVVTLTGHVKSFLEKTTVERAVKGLKGVRAIADEIEIRYPSHLGNPDDVIAARAANVVRWTAIVPDETIKISVHQGHVTLEGEVAWQYQRQGLENAMKNLTGIKGVSNLLTLRTRPEPTNVRHAIEEALKRNAEIDARNIIIKVVGDTVRLEGHVHAWHERQVAEHAAWAVPGVAKVEDHLIIA